MGNLAEELLLVTASSALTFETFPVLSAVVPVVACVAAAVAGVNYFRLSLAGLFCKNTLHVHSLIFAPLQTITNVAVHLLYWDKVCPLIGSKRVEQIAGPLPAPASRSNEVVVSSNREQIYLNLSSSSSSLGQPSSLLTQALVSFNLSARSVYQQLVLRTPCESIKQTHSPHKLLHHTPCIQSPSLRVFAIEFSDDEEENDYSSSSLDWPCSVAQSPMYDPSLASECSAVASLGLDRECPERIRQLLPEAMLLQFGAMIGEEPCIQELRQRQLAWGWGHSTSIFGIPDGGHADPGHWEPIVDDTAHMLRYKAWRRPLRRGFYMYMSTTIIDGVTTKELQQFNLNNTTRFLWDDTAMVLEDLEPYVPGCYSGIQQYRCRYPTPMAAREYVYARRVWSRPTDGGCYCVSRSCETDKLAKVGGRVVRISDYVSCFVIKAAPSETGHPKGAVEVAAVYFEDPRMQPGLTNLAIRKGLFGFVQKHARAVRDYFQCADSSASAIGAADNCSTQLTDSRAAAIATRRMMTRRRFGGGKRLRHKLLLMFFVKLVHSTLLK